MGEQRQDQSRADQQPYDTLLKSLFEGQEEQVLPHFLDGAVYLETLDIEVMRTILRVDRVYKVLYKGDVHILHLEFETNSKSGMAARLLDYHAYLYRKYELPVISTIIYPFRTTVAQSPLIEISHGKQILIFHFRVLELWELNAEKYVQTHTFALYALLPAMGGASPQLLLRAIEEMVQYYQDDKFTLARELRWMGIILRGLLSTSPVPLPGALSAFQAGKCERPCLSVSQLSGVVGVSKAVRFSPLPIRLEQG